MSTALASAHAGETERQKSARVEGLTQYEQMVCEEPVLHPCITAAVLKGLHRPTRHMALALGYQPYQLLWVGNLSRAVWGESLHGHAAKMLSRFAGQLRNKGLAIESRGSQHSYVLWPEGVHKAPVSVLSTEVVWIGRWSETFPVGVVDDLVFDRRSGRLWRWMSRESNLLELPLRSYPARGLYALTGSDLSRSWSLEEIGLEVWPDCLENARASATDKSREFLKEFRSLGIAYRIARGKVQLITQREGG